ncbi:hypothetical protein C1645_769807 [Glomus cerebriforme]|uniref:Uncharacterized protein n=1 Tax=Glomus cerebriforme TaxID=658196 RepID=A0A397T0Z2_9GLOM|nr:hypothetical protein C1645_769807 [Glomus cerebriforme]
MRSSTLAIFLVALLFTITLAFAEETQQIEKRQYGYSAGSTIELSFMTFAIMVFTSLFAF